MSHQIFLNNLLGHIHYIGGIFIVTILIRFILYISYIIPIVSPPKVTRFLRKVSNKKDRPRTGEVAQIVECLPRKTDQLSAGTSCL
jgi:hypothetical protein